MFCQNCGKEINNDVMFCPFCGTQQNVTQQEVFASSETHSDETQEVETSRDETTNDLIKVKIMKLLPKIGFYSLISGMGIFLLIVIVGLIGYGKVYLYDGYSFTKVFCTISLILMLAGIVICGGLLIYKIIKKEFALDKKVILKIIAIALSLIFSIVLFSNAANTNKKSYSGGSSSSGSMSAYTYALLYCNITNVRVTHNSSYTVCTGTITNKGTQSVRYVKVRGSFQNSSGSTLDTDWTYAIGSEWLKPGESTTFRMSVPKDTSIKKCSVSIMS